MGQNADRVPIPKAISIDPLWRPYPEVRPVIESLSAEP